MGVRTARFAAVLGKFPYGAGVPAPVLTGTPALAASWDFGNASSLTMASGIPAGGGHISSIAGVDGTSIALAAVNSGPVSVIRNGKMTASFTTSPMLQVANDLGLSTAGQCTMVAIWENNGNTQSSPLIEVGQAAANFLNRRYSLYTNAGGVGPSMARSDNANTRVVVSYGALNTGVHILIGRSLPGSGSNVLMNYDGTGTALVGTGTVGIPTAMDTTTLGGTRQSGVNAAGATGWFSRALVYNTALSDAQVEQIAVWANTYYGTANNG